MLELSLAEQVAELKEQLRKANERRATADRAAEEMQTTVTELREQIVKRGEEQKTLTDEAGKEVKKIKSSTPRPAGVSGLTGSRARSSGLISRTASA